MAPASRSSAARRRRRSLLADLRSDVGMEWVPDDMWLSYLQLDAAAGDLDYDLAVSADPDREPSITDAGVGPASVVPVRAGDPGTPWWPLARRAARRVWPCWRRSPSLPWPRRAVTRMKAGRASRHRRRCRARCRRGRRTPWPTTPVPPAVGARSRSR